MFAIENQLNRLIISGRKSGPRLQIKIVSLFSSRCRGSVVRSPAGTKVLQLDSCYCCDNYWLFLHEKSKITEYTINTLVFLILVIDEFMITFLKERCCVEILKQLIMWKQSRYFSRFSVYMSSSIKLKLDFSVFSVSLCPVQVNVRGSEARQQERMQGMPSCQDSLSQSNSWVVKL